MGLLTSRCRGALALLLILAGATAIFAEESVTPPSGTRAVADTPPQLVLPREHLLGDWLGARTWLEARGITPSVTLVTDALGNPTGGLQQGFRGASNLGVDLLFELDRLFGLAGGSFEVSFSARFGSSLSQEDIGNVFSVQQVFGGETYRVVNVAYQQQMLGDRLQLRVGRVAAGDDFLVSPYDYVFVQNGFDGNPVGIFFNAPGMTAYPNATWGGLVKGRPTEQTYVMIGLYNGDPTIHENKHHGADWSMAGPLFAIGEAGYNLNGLPGDRGLIGNYRVGLWYDDSQYTDFNAVTPGRISRLSRGNWGFYGLADQVLVQFGGPSSNRGLGVTASILVSQDESVSQMPFFATAGVLARGIFASRPTDVGGSAFCTVASVAISRTPSGAHGRRGKEPASSGTKRWSS